MYRLKQLTVLAGDFLCYYLGLYLALALRYFAWPQNQFSLLFSPMMSLFFAAIVIMFVAGLYDLGRAKNVWPFYQRLLMSAVSWAIVGIIFFYTNPTASLTPKTILLLTTICSFCFIAVWRTIYNRYISTSIWRTNVAFAGTSKEVEELIKILHLEPERGYQVTGIIESSATIQLPLGVTVPITKTVAELQTKNHGQLPNIVVIAPSESNNTNLLNELYTALFSQTSIVSLVDFYEEIVHHVPPFIFSESWFITNLHEQQKKIYDRFRILFDYTVAFAMGLVCLILFPFIGLAIKLNSKGAVLFRQNRVGRLGKTFTIYKFRTMQALHADGSAEAHGPQFAAHDDARVTKVGKFLRRTRLDEIPQFINILRGEMGLIGPRPERPEFVAELTKQMPFYTLRHLIKPGLTGWAQLHRSYYGTIEENLFKLQYDLFYIKNRGLLLDIVILLRTINVLIRMAGR